MTATLVQSWPGEVSITDTPRFTLPRDAAAGASRRKQSFQPIRGSKRHGREFVRDPP